MKKLFIAIIVIVFFERCFNKPQSKEMDNLFCSTIPDLTFFNANEVIKNKTIALINQNDTMAFYVYDSLGRFRQYIYTKMWSRKENLYYFDKSRFPIYKTIRVDYFLSFLGSLVKTNNDTIQSFWYRELGDIQDTFQYVFQDNKIKEIVSSSLNDHEQLKLKRTFLYNNDRPIKIVALPVWGEAAGGLGLIDSIVVYYKYSGKLVNEITENYYCVNKKYNHKNLFFFNNLGFPIKCVKSDTMEFVIK
jgi:hypothetical protein